MKTRVSAPSFSPDDSARVECVEKNGKLQSGRLRHATVCKVQPGEIIWEYSSFLQGSLSYAGGFGGYDGAIAEMSAEMEEE
jgi:hypothetical protein